MGQKIGNRTERRAGDGHKKSFENPSSSMQKRMEQLLEPEIREKIEAVFKANGKITGKRPKAGISYGYSEIE